MTDELDNFLPDYGDDYERECSSGDDGREEGCSMPGRCLMPGPHLRSECHDVEMMRDFERERRAMPEPGDYILRFGKHKGCKLRDVPTGYLDWMLGLDDLRADTREAIESYLKTQSEYDAMDGDAPDWKDGRDDLDWRDL